VFYYFLLLLSPFLLLTFFPRLSLSLFLLVQLTFILLPFGLFLHQLPHFNLLYVSYCYIFLFLLLYLVAFNTLNALRNSIGLKVTIFLAILKLIMLGVICVLNRSMV